MDDDVIEQINLDEFDRGTRLEVMGDESLRLTLALMPPSWWNGVDALEDLERQMARALDADVSQEDKELFVIHAPPPDAVDRVRAFLLEVRRTYPTTAPEE